MVYVLLNLTAIVNDYCYTQWIKCNYIYALRNLIHMIQKKPLKFVSKLTAYIISIFCIATGSIGLFLSVYNYQSIVIPLFSIGFIFIGIIYGITAFKGKPVNYSKSNKKSENT